MRLQAAATALLLTLSLPTPAQAASPNHSLAAQADVPWREIPLPFFWPRNSLQDVSGSSPSNVWAVGNQGSIPIFAPPLSTFVWTDGNPVVRRWDGAAWREVPLPGFPRDGQVRRVETTATETWVLGQGNGAGGNYLARFSGTAFTRIALPPELGDSILGLSAGPSGTYIYGYGTDSAGYLGRWTGTAWERQSLPSGHLVRAMTDLGGGDVWAVGSLVRPGVGWTYAALHRTGTTWTPTPVPVPAGDQEGYLVSVAALSPTDVWAVGNQTGLTGDRLRHWNGTAWEAAPNPANLPYPIEAVANGTGTLWLYGQDQAYAPVVLRRIPSGWATTPAPPARLISLTALPGTSALWGSSGVDPRTAIFTTG